MFELPETVRLQKQWTRRWEPPVERRKDVSEWGAESQALD